MIYDMTHVNNTAGFELLQLKYHGSYRCLKFQFQELSRRKRVIFPGVFRKMHRQNFTRLLHTFLHCMCRPTDNQQKCTKNMSLNDAMAKHRLTVTDCPGKI